MLNKNIYFNHTSPKTGKYLKNLKETKKKFQLLKKEVNNLKNPLLNSFEKSYPLDFTPKIIKKFSNFKNIVVLGMGGSILGTKSIYYFSKNKIKKKVFFFDNLELDINTKLNKIKKIGNSCFIVISKSGNTLETITNLNFVFSKIKIKNNLVFITELKESSLMRIAKKYNAEIIEHKNFIGGRYSVLSEVGMFPASLMGLDIQKFRKLNKFINNKNFVKCLIQNVAFMYTLYNKKIKNSVVFSYDTKLNELSYWYQQLIAESLGKKKHGINPIISFGPKDHHSLLQLYLDGPKDKFFTFLSSENSRDNKKISTVIRAQCLATKNILKKNKIPLRHFVFNKNDESELGTVFTYFILETILLAKLMKVNAFDQPAVESIKAETQKILRS